MKQQTKNALGILTASILALTAGSNVYARGGHGPDCYRGGSDDAPRALDRRGGQMNGLGGPMELADPAAITKQLEQLKSSLAITAEQEQAWESYAKVVTERATAMKNQREEVQAARQTLLAALTPEQRSEAAQLMGAKHFRGRRSDTRMGFADPAATTQRLEQLKTSLAIQPDQEAAWDKYAKAVNDRASAVQSQREARLSGDVTATQMDEFRQSSQTQREEIRTARQELYAALTPEQRTEADQLMRAKRHHGRGW